MTARTEHRLLTHQVCPYIAIMRLQNILERIGAVALAALQFVRDRQGGVRLRYHLPGSIFYHYLSNLVRVPGAIVVDGGEGNAHGFKVVPSCRHGPGESVVDIWIGKVQADIPEQIDAEQLLGIVPELSEVLLAIRVGVIENAVLHRQSGSNDLRRVASLYYLDPQVVIGREYDQFVVSWIGAVHAEVIPGKDDILGSAQGSAVPDQSRRRG